MGLESATFISDLVTTNPTGSDDYSTADDHLRLLKSVLQAQFPNFTANAVNATPAELNILDGALLNVSDLNVLAGADAAGLTPTELAFLNGVSSNIQTQLDAKAAASHNHDASAINSGQFATARIPNLDASKITSGSFAASIIGSGTFDDARIAESNVTQHSQAVYEDSVQSKFKAADTTRASTATVAADPHLVGIALAANAVYRVTGILDCEVDGVTGGGLKVQFTSGATPQGGSMSLRFVAASTLESKSGNFSTVLSEQPAATGYRVHLEGHIFTHLTSGNTIGLSWAQETSDSEGTIIKAGSFLKAERIYG